MKTKALHDQQTYRVIDDDAHAADTEDSWSYVEGLDKTFTPQLFQFDENPNSKLWVIGRQAYRLSQSDSYVA